MREVARRVFAAEYNKSDLDVKEGETQYAPTYIITPTGEKCNRLFIVGVLTEVEDIGSEESMYRGRVSDPTGSFLIYAGRFQPEAAQTLSTLEPPEFVAITGKADIYRPEEGESIASIRPEAINKVDREERDRWIVTTAERTIERLENFQNLSEKVKEHYKPSLNEYKDIVREALRSLIEEEGKEERKEREDVDVAGVKEDLSEADEVSEMEKSGFGENDLEESGSEKDEDEVEEWSFSS